MDMTEAQEKKAELESEILELLCSYERETGCTISSIYISRSELNEISRSPQRSKLNRVDITAEI